MDALKTIAAASVKETTPEFSVGDTVKVSVNIREGERERIQMFEGTVIAKRGSGVAETFTVSPTLNSGVVSFTLFLLFFNFVTCYKEK